MTCWHINCSASLLLVCCAWPHASTMPAFMQHITWSHCTATVRVPGDSHHLATGCAVLLSCRHHHLGPGDPQPAAQTAAAEGETALGCRLQSLAGCCRPAQLDFTAYWDACILSTDMRSLPQAPLATWHQTITTCTMLALTAQVKIQALAFSPDEQWLASLGGQDDNSLVRMGCKAWWCFNY